MSDLIPVRAWSVDCGARSLNQRVCILPANHQPKTHRADDGREWEPNQNWQDEINRWFQAQEGYSIPHRTDNHGPHED